MNVIEISANEYQELRSNQIMSIFMRSYQRKCLIQQLRAFRRWSESFPLQVKCIEISRQLGERNEMLESLRSSYLKDVVSVKYQLSQLSSLTKESVDQHISRKVIEEKLSGLHMVPSADLRHIVDKAEKTIKSDGTSTMLRDTLVDAGLMDPETCKVYNPWEQSRSYRRLNRMQKGPAYNYPDTGGNSMELAKPYDYKLFIRYCRDCVGVVQFVKSWNTDIEATLRFKAEYGQVELRIQELRRVIDSLQNAVVSKEQTIIRLDEKNKELEEANHWFEKWSYIKDVEQREAEHKERLNMYMNLVDMAQAEKESIVWSIQHQNNETVADLQHKLKDLQRALRKDQTDRDQEASTRIKIAEELQHVLSQKSAMKAEIDRLKSLRSQDANDHDALLKRIKKTEAVCQELEVALSKKEREFEDHRRVTADRIDELVQQYKTVSRDYEAKEKELDDMRIELRKKKKQNTEYAIEISDLKSCLDHYRAEERKTRPKRNEPGYRPTFKVVAISILSLIRLHRAAHQRQWEDLGYFGSQLLNRQHNQRILDLRQELLESQKDSADNQRLLDQFRLGKEEMQRKLRELEELAEKRRDEIRQLTRSLEDTNCELLMTKAQRDEASSKLSDCSKAKRDLILPILHRAKIYSNLQRNIAAQLAKSIFASRAIIRSFDVESNMSQIYREKALLEKILAANDTRQLTTTTTLTAAASPSNDIISTVNSPTRKRASPVQAAVVMTPTNLTVIRQLDFAAILRNKGNRLINWIRSYHPQHQIKLMKNGDELVERWMSGSELILTSTESQSLLTPEAHIRYLHRKDESMIETMHGELITDIRMVDDYISLLRERNDDLQKRLEQAIEDVNNARAENYNNKTNNTKSDRSIASHGSRGSRESGQSTLRHLKVRHVKSSFAHLMEKDMSTYLSKVIEAIETVQSEHADLASVRDDMSSAGAVSLDSGSAAGGGEFHSAVRTAGSTKRTRRSTMIRSQHRIQMSDAILEESTPPTSFSMRVDQVEVSPNKGSNAANSNTNNDESSQSPQRSSISGRRSRRRSSVVKRSSATRRSIASTHSGTATTVPSHHASGQILPPLYDTLPKMETISGVDDDDEMQIMRAATAAAALWQGGEPQTAGSNHNNSSNNKRMSKQAVILDRSGHSILRRSGGVATIGGSSESNKQPKSAEHHRHASTATQLTDISATEESLKLEYYFMPRDDDPIRSPVKIETTDDDFVNNDDDLLDDDDLLYEDDLVSVYDDLEAAKKEALMFLQHNQQMQKEIDFIKAEKEQLWTEIGGLRREISDLRRAQDSQNADSAQLKDDLATLTLDYETMRHENGLLREMVMDGYRFHSAEQEDMLRKIAEKARLKEEQYRRQLYCPKQNAETQIACSVCAIREFQIQSGEAGVGLINGGIEEQHTVPEVHETLTTALRLGTTNNRYFDNDNIVPKQQYAVLTARSRYLVRAVGQIAATNDNGMKFMHPRQHIEAETMATMMTKNRPISAPVVKRGSSPPHSTGGNSRPTSPVQQQQMQLLEDPKFKKPLLFTEQVMQIIHRPPSPKSRDATGTSAPANNNNSSSSNNRRRPHSATAAMLPSASELSGVQQHQPQFHAHYGGDQRTSYGAKHVLQYAMTLMHDGRARPTSGNIAGQTSLSNRPLSGSKFRKLKQMPRSSSTSTLQKATSCGGVAMVMDESAFPMEQDGVRALVHSAALIQHNKQLDRNSLVSDGSSNPKWLPAVDLKGSVATVYDDEMDLHSGQGDEDAQEYITYLKDFK